MTENTSPSEFIRFVEVNESEGELWNFWLQVNGNEHQLEDLAELLLEATFDENGNPLTKDGLPFALEDDYEDERIVDALVHYADESGYMPTHQKITGKFTCPTNLGENLEKLVKGGIKKFFTDVDRG